MKFSFIKMFSSVFTRLMKTIYLSHSTQVADGTVYKKYMASMAHKKTKCHQKFA